MNKKEDKEEKIKKWFTIFFSDFKESVWRPTDFKKYQKSIYNILCSSYKDRDNTIDRTYIIENLVPEDKKNNFRHTNIYNKRKIVSIFKSFFTSQKNKGKTTWNIWDLEERNNSLLITLSKIYWRQWKQYVDREKFIKEYNLDKLGYTFIRNAPIRTPITIEEINNELFKIIQTNQAKWSPNSLVQYKPQYLKRLGKKYRDEKWKIDWLYIIHKVLSDNEVISKFRHRYAYDRLLKVPSKTKENIQIDSNYWRIDNDTLNPEEMYIQKEEEIAKEIMINKIYQSIETNLSNEEKETLFSFLEGDSKGKAIEDIIFKIKKNLENNDSII